MGKPKSSAQRQREFRERMKSDPTKLKEAKEKERLRWHNRKQKGAVKPINELSARAQRQKRKSWRQAKDRQKQKTEESIAMSSQDQAADNRQTVTGKKVARRTRVLLNKKVHSLEAKLEKGNKLLACYRKRLERSRPTYKSPSTPGRKETPRTASRRVMRGPKSAMARQLVFHFATIGELAAKNNEIRSRKEKRIFNRIFKGTIFKKYRLRSKAKKYFGLSRSVIKDGSEGSLVTLRTKYYSKTVKLAQLTKAFFCRDDNSRITTTKSQTITRCKVKQPKRFLLADLIDLHSKFVKENPSLIISYTTFTRLKPFYVVKPQEADRESCLCKRHENIRHMADKLHYLKITSTSNTEKLIEEFVCSTTSKDCMYRLCAICKMKKLISDSDLAELDLATPTWWWEWRTVKETYEQLCGTTGIMESRVTQKTVKEKVTATIRELVDKMNKDITTSFAQHVFNIQHQFEQFTKVKSTLDANTAIVHVDFSENYNCKYADEIQAMHFGASHQQASLHTGVIYTATGHQSFCTISPSRQHGPSAIWAHLEPVLKSLDDKIKTVHFWSDGPTTQYRNKSNFYLLSTDIFKYGLTAATWNFSEASHGKGAPDGVGGAVKRKADSFLNNKVDVPNALALYDLVNGRGDIMYSYITQEDINSYEKELPKSIATVKGTMKIHQLNVVTKYSLSHRVLSCFCADNCKCYDLKIINFDPVPQVVPLHHNSVSTAHPPTPTANELSERQQSTQTSAQSCPIVQQNVEHVDKDTNAAEDSNAELLDACDDKVIGNCQVICYCQVRWRNLCGIHLGYR